MLFSDRVAGAARSRGFWDGTGAVFVVRLKLIQTIYLYFKTCYFNGNIRYRNLYFDCILICYRLESNNFKSNRLKK